MTADQRNALNYFVLAFGAFVLGCAAALIPQLMDPSMPDLNFRVVIGTGLTAVVTAYGGSRLPRTGSARLSAQVEALRADNVSRADMAVVDTTRPPEEIAERVADVLERRREERVKARLEQAATDGAKARG